MTPTIYNPAPHTTPYRAPSNTDRTNDTETLSVDRKKRGVADTANIWPQHSTIKISFIGMTKEQEAFTKENINKWAPHVNLKFEFTDKPDGDIRIAVDSGSGPSWSDVGMAAKRTPLNEPTMLINFSMGEGTGTATVIQHEFGHALGLKHEHQHPDNELNFNHERVYQDHEKGGRSRAATHNSVIRKYDRSKVTTSDYDQQSIMHYPFSRKYLNGGKEVYENVELSAGDIKFVRSLYPSNSENRPSPSKPDQRPHPLQNPVNLPSS